MSLTQVQTRHEFLFRWNDQGARQGAHIGYREAIVDSATGAEVASKFLDPRPVSLTDVADLADIAAAINVATLADCEAKAAQIATLTQAATDAATAHAAELATATAAREAAVAQAQELQAQIDALKPPTINGVPQEVTMRQAQIALNRAGLLTTVEAAIASMPGAAGVEARITWAKSSAVKRHDPLIATLQPALGLTDAQIDALFVLAATL
jgi:hypothetical protein